GPPSAPAAPAPPPGRGTDVGETRVDLLHLLEDLRDAYPGATEETILVEIVANSLDSGATTVTIATDPTIPAFAAVDDGAGASRRAGHGGATQADERALAAPRRRLRRDRAAPSLPAAVRSGADRDPRGSVPARRALRPQRAAAHHAGLGGAVDRAARRPARPQAEGRRGRLYDQPPAGTRRGPPRDRDQHLRQGHQARVGLARGHARGARRAPPGRPATASPRGGRAASARGRRAVRAGSPGARRAGGVALPRRPIARRARRALRPGGVDASRARRSGGPPAPRPVRP